MGALLVALAGFASAWAYRDKDRSTIATLYYLWALAWWWGDAHNEVRRFVEPAARADVLLAVAAASGWLAAEVHRRRPSPALALTTLAGFLAAIPLAFALLGMRALVCLRGNGDRFAAHAQFAWWLVWPTALSLLAWHLADRFALAGGWARALWVLPWLLVAAVSLFRWPWLAAPQGDGFARHRTPLQSVYFAGIALWWLAA
jgi:hypothetical protein